MTLEITNAVSRFFAAVDLCDWPAVQALMSPKFHADYSSFTGGDPADVTPEELTGAWAELLPFFDNVHHQIGNLVVTQIGNTAKVQCHGTACHFIADHPGGDVQFIIGTYDIDLVQEGDAWTLWGMRFNFRFATGNPELAAEAKRRAEAQAA